MNWVDVAYYPSLVRNLNEIDLALDRLSAWASETGDPDSDGTLDEMEELVGEGFFHLQHFMVRRKRRTTNAHSYGPAVAGGEPFARIVHEASNYWKHIDEWPDDANLNRQQRRTLAVVTSGGSTHGEYPLTNLLRSLTADERLSSLLPRMVEWREALDRSLSV